MSGNITLALYTAQSGLLASQAALDAVANNISNVNTIGYSRKVVNFEQRVVADSGAGVQLTQITRNIDEGLLKSLRTEISNFNRLDVKTTYFERIQEIFGKPGDDNSINHHVQSLLEAMEGLAQSPDRTIEQQEVVRWADQVALSLSFMTTTIQDLRLQADKAIEDLVNRANALTAQIEELNNKIIRNETIKHDVTDLKDKRDLALNELVKIMDIQYFERNSGDVVVFTKGGKVLVDNSAKTITHNAATSITAITTFEEGHIGGIHVGSGTSSANDLTLALQGGMLKGLIELRDEILPNLQAQMDELATEMRDAINLAHNRGAPYPGLDNLTGSRTFIDPGTQTITLSGGDVTIAVVDAGGDQVVTTTLDTIMQSALFGTGAQAANGPWTIDEVAQTLQDWLQDNANGGPNLAGALVSVNADGKFTLETGSTTNFIVFRDETATADGSTAGDVSIRYDADGNGVVDQVHSGFSNFFGLNDFFVTSQEPTRFDSEVQPTTQRWNPAVDVTLTFTDADGNSENVTFTQAGGPYTLQQIVDAINDTTSGISFATATLITDGSGVRLRITHDSATAMAITDDAGAGNSSSLMEALGIKQSSARAAQFLQVRSDISATPALMSRGMLQWDANLGPNGQYFMSAGDNTIAQAMADTLGKNNQFDTAGGIAGTTTSFVGYASAIIAKQASIVATNENRWSSQKGLTESLQLKSDNVRGVNLDEEMSNLILYQQAYSAAARVIATIKEMFDVLMRA